MPVTINSGLASSGGGSGSGGGGGGSGGGTELGEVRQFLAGAVPEGWAQIAGVAPVPAQGAVGVFLAAHLGGLTGQAGEGIWPVATRQGRMFVSAKNSQLLEVDANLNPVAQPVTIPNLASNYPCLFVPLDDGNLLRVGGTASASAGASLQVYNVNTKTFGTLASKPSATMSGTYSKACQAGNGKVYGVFDQASNMLSSFDPAMNAWTDFVSGVSFTGTSCIGITRLPSGKLFMCSTGGQYIYDPDNYPNMTQIGSQTGVHAILETPRGARMYTMNAVYAGNTIGMAFTDYDEESNTFTNIDPKQPRPGAASIALATAPGYGVARNPYTGADVITSLAAGTSVNVTYLHHQPYIPRGVVSASKV